MKRFDEYMKHFSEVEGWFQTPSHRYLGQPSKLSSGTTNLRKHDRDWGMEGEVRCPGCFALPGW